MPNILVLLPAGAYPGQSRQVLMRRVNDAAAQAEHVPDNVRHRALCWVLVQELPEGQWACGGGDVTDQIVPCLVRVSLPAGVLDEAGRALYAKLMHDAFVESLPADDKRSLQLSMILEEIPDGFWGVNQQLWRLNDFAKAAGYGHLQKAVSAPMPLT